MRSVFYQRRMRREKILTLFVAIISSALSSCGGGVQSGVIGKFGYRIQENPYNAYACDTGYKEASSREEFCSWFANDRVNQDPRSGQVCSLSLRKQNFDANCKGFTWTGATP